MNERPKTARAAVVVKANAPLEYREYPVPDPGSGQVLLRVLCTNICGSDIHMFRGEAFPGGKGLPYAYLLGHEFVGEVVALGEGVKKDALGAALSVGDRVTLSYYRGCGNCKHCTGSHEHICLQATVSLVQPVDNAPHFVGAFAEYYLVRRGQKLFKLPTDLSPSLCAGINCALAQVIQGLNEIGIRYGDQVVIQGAGGLGLYAVALAKEMGAGNVIAIDGFAARLAFAERMGADATISLEELPDPRQRTQKVKELTGGGADVVVEVVGHADALKEGIRMLDRGGRYLVMGAINPKQTFAADPSIWIGGNLDLRGVSLYHPMVLKQGIDFVARNKDRLPLEEMIVSYPFDDADAALAAAIGRSDACRIQLDIAGVSL